MRKKLLLALCALTLIIGGTVMTEMMFGFDILPEMPAITPRQKQLEYLKDHEQEIVDFVKSQNPKIESVQIDWETMNVEAIGGSLVDKGYFLSVDGKFNNLETTMFSVDFYLEKPEDIPDIEAATMLNDISILKDGGWYIYE